MASFKPSWLLYGATGFSGRLIAQAAKASGHNVIFAGRDAGANLMTHVAGHRRIAVGDRLALALEATQRFHQRLRLRLQRRIVELLVGVRRRRQQVLSRGGGR